MKNKVIEALERKETQLQESTEQALTIPVVSQQRKLLIGVLRDLFPNGSTEVHADYVDKYLANL